MKGCIRLSNKRCRKESNDRFNINIYFNMQMMLFKIFLFILLTFGCAGSLLLHGLSLVVGSRGYPLVVVHGLLIAVASLVAEHRL